MNKKRRELIQQNEISKLVTYQLGGFEQKVVIDGAKATNPLLLFLHGGPGSPIPFSVGSRGLFPKFTEEFTMVYWDQLGCGINNHVIDDSFTIDTFVNMTVDLIKELKNEFSQNKILVFGISWGSVLAAKAASIIPALIDSVLTYGQVLKELTFNDEVYYTLKLSELPDKGKNDILMIQHSNSHTIKEMKRVMRYVQKYTDGYQNNSGEKSPVGSILWGLLTSPDYSIADFLAIVKNGSSKNNSLIKELLALDLSDILCKITIPYRIMQGDTDIVTSTERVFEFVQASENENLTIQIVNENGHMPGKKGIEAIYTECRLMKNEMARR